MLIETFKCCVINEQQIFRLIFGTKFLLHAYYLYDHECDVIFVVALKFSEGHGCQVIYIYSFYYRFQFPFHLSNLHVVK